jgi:hypothetical protein
VDVAALNAKRGKMAIATVKDDAVEVREDNGQIMKRFTPGHGRPVSAHVDGEKVVVQLENGMTSVHTLTGQVLRVF